MYPAAPGLSPSDRPPPFALVRSSTTLFGVFANYLVVKTLQNQVG